MVEFAKALLGFVCLLVVLILIDATVVDVFHKCIRAYFTERGKYVEFLAKQEKTSAEAVAAAEMGLGRTKLN